MKRFICTLIIGLVASATAHAEWKIAGDRLRTNWAEQVTPESVLPEYPRPQLVRGEWQNLNGLWNYAITAADAAQPASFEGEILVPFALESALSGVQKSLTERDALWYERTFSVPSKWLSQRVMLNFGAVDWQADVYVNDILVGSHTGGYTPFSLDITSALKKGAEQRLTVRVWDPTDKEQHPIGKQCFNPTGIWYTPVSGIWQTVWLEPVAKQNHIVAVTPTSDIRNGCLVIDTHCDKPQGIVSIEVKDGDTLVGSAKAVCGTPAIVHIPNAKLWSPEMPHLYTLKVSLTEGGKSVDCVESYAAMREFSTKRDEGGHLRLCLNGKPVFMYGPLDQGWWPDGLYTAPTDEALLSDVTFTKAIGFNTIRKHVKVEPARWYYHCDREGVIVWQDMPSMFFVRGRGLWGRNYMGAGTDSPVSERAKENFRKEWREVMDALRFFPSIGVWVPFNEAWGQFDTEQIAAWTKQYDPSRLVNAASGGNLRECGDIIDLHNYPAPAMPVHHAGFSVVLGEYGGIGYPMEEHLWWNKRNWGYIKFSSIAEVTDEYVKYAHELKPLIRQGLSAAIYTQTTDVEGEVNGILTYDRKVVKMDKERVRAVNQEIINCLK